MAEGRERVERGGGGEASGGIHQARMLTLLTVAFMTSLARTFIMLNAINASRRRKEESETLGASKKALPRVASLVKSLVAVLLLLQLTHTLQPKRYTHKGIISRQHPDCQVQIPSTNTPCTK